MYSLVMTVTKKYVLFSNDTTNAFYGSIKKCMWMLENYLGSTLNVISHKFIFYEAENDGI